MGARIVSLPQALVEPASLKRGENGCYYGRTHDRKPVQFRSVTSVLNVISKSEALIKWAVRVMGDYIRKNAVVGGVLTYEHRDYLIENGQKEHDRIKYEAADLGTRAHELIAMWLRREVLPDLSREDERIQNCLKRFWEWWQGKNLRVVRVEYCVFNAAHGYAGKLDFLAQLPSGQYALLDWKTSNALHVEFYLQVAAYLMALLCMGYRFAEFAEVTIVRCGREDAYFEPCPIPLDALPVAYRAFRHCLELTNCLSFLNTIENVRSFEHKQLVRELEAATTEETVYAF